MSKTHKYFKYRSISQNGQVQHCVVWDGIKDWKNQPAIQGLRLAGEIPGQKVAIIRIDMYEDWVDMLLKGPLPGCDSIVFWTNNRKTYRTIIRYQEVITPIQ